jgi:hypothetical protein
MSLILMWDREWAVAKLEADTVLTDLES